MSKKINVLIIDDNIDDLEFYRELLLRSSSNYQVYTAESGDEGLALYQEKKIDCCVIDYNIPDKSGVEILGEISVLSPEHKATIILTGVHHQKVQAKAARKGALDYIEKSAHTSPEAFDKVVLKVIDWAKQLNEKEGLASSA